MVGRRIRKRSRSLIPAPTRFPSSCRIFARALPREYRPLSPRDGSGQGPQVASLEECMSERFRDGNSALAVGAGTDALHLAYLLAGVWPDDEVTTPVFTCIATNILVRPCFGPGLVSVAGYLRWVQSRAYSIGVLSFRLECRRTWLYSWFPSAMTTLAWSTE